MGLPLLLLLSSSSSSSSTSSFFFLSFLSFFLSFLSFFFLCCSILVSFVRFGPDESYLDNRRFNQLFAPTASFRRISNPILLPAAVTTANEKSNDWKASPLNNQWIIIGKVY